MIIDIILGTNQLLTYLTDKRCPMSKDTRSVQLVECVSSSLHLDHTLLSSTVNTFTPPQLTHVRSQQHLFLLSSSCWIKFLLLRQYHDFLEIKKFLLFWKSQRNIKGKHGAKNKHLSLTNIYQTKQAIQDNLGCTKYGY